MKKSNDIEKLLQYYSNDEIKELIAIKEQLKKAEKEAASTLTFELPKKRKSSFIYIKVIIPLAFVCCIIVSILGFTLFHETNATEQVSVTEQIHDLATLATASAEIKTIFEHEDYRLFGNELPLKIPGAKRNVFIVVGASVIAGVDLRSVTDKDVVVNEKEKTITIAIPHSTFISEPAINMNDIRAFSSEGIFRREASIEEGYQLAAEAIEQIKTEAIEAGILTQADENAKKVLQEFFKTLGYETTVTFRQ